MKETAAQEGANAATQRLIRQLLNRDTALPEGRALEHALDDCGRWRQQVEQVLHARQGNDERAAEEAFAAAIEVDDDFAAVMIHESPSRRDNVTLADMGKFYGSVTWAWPGWIPAGHITLIAGDTGVGKSYFSAGLMAAFMGARAFPDGTRFPNTGKVLLVETEEMRGPYAERLSHLGVDTRDVVAFTANGEMTYIPDLAQDTDAITAMAAEEHCVAVVVDSLSGGHGVEENSAEMRSLMRPLAEMAAGLGVPVLVVHHARKRSALEPPEMGLARIRGSSTIAQFPRSILGLSKATSSDIIRVECLKSSFAEAPDPFGFQITDTGISYVDAPRVPQNQTATERAVAFLEQELGSGPQRYTDLQAKATAAEISKNALYRAKDALQVTMREGKWTLPPSTETRETGEREKWERREHSEPRQRKLDSEGNGEDRCSSQTSQGSHPPGPGTAGGSA
jgi:hypothetical protein